MQAQWHKTNPINIVPSRTELTRTHQNPHAKAGLPKAVVDAKGQQKASLHKKIFGLSIFIFAQNLWHAVIKNANTRYAHRR